MSKRITNCLIGIISLGMGGMFYIAVRPSTYISHWLRVSNGEADISDPFVILLSFYLPDFLWALSLGSFLCALFAPKVKEVFVCAITVFSTGVAWETLQYFGVVSGTGDFLDVLMYLLAAVITAVINLKGILK